MEAMKSLYETTKQILDTVNKDHFTVDERTVVIEKINDLLEKREVILEKIKAPYSKEEEVIGGEVVKLDKLISEKMDFIYKTIQQDLKQLKHQKDSNKTYINPYKDMNTVDGMYLDNKL
ncbi:MAG TPA: hypothetical protein VFF20_11075 [Pseudogracilibacillus sp.]|nr:hypothetical protein [Pseudogracilibacillus sp.]